MACVASGTLFLGFRFLSGSLRGSAAFLNLARSFESSATAGIIDVEDDAQYKTELDKAAEAGKVAVLNFTAGWCGPCKMMAPILEAQAAEQKQMVFLRLDLDAQPLAATINSHGISAVPTYKFIKNRDVVDSLVGADRNQLLTYISKWAAH